MGTSKTSQRHAELVSVSPRLQGIAGQARNDGSVTDSFFKSPYANLCFSVVYLAKADFQFNFSHILRLKAL